MAEPTCLRPRRQQSERRNNYSLASNRDIENVLRFNIGIATPPPGHPALSSPLPEDEWSGHRGFIHKVALDHHLASHENPLAIEFYLCGPPAMIKACTKMLDGLGVSASQIAFDEF